MSYLISFAQTKPVPKGGPDDLPLNVTISPLIYDEKTRILITSREYKGYFEKVDNENGTILVKNINLTEALSLHSCCFHKSTEYEVRSKSAELSC